MTTAQELSKRSETERVTMADVVATGAAWSSVRQAFVFADDSAGYFDKNRAVRRVIDEKTNLNQMSHYEFVVAAEVN